MFQNAERQFVRNARVARLATADGSGRPHAVPICFALDADVVVTPVDEKPQDVDPAALRRCRNIDENPRVALVVDRYTEDWSRLGWVQVRGTATVCESDDPSHGDGVAALREKYTQYTDHSLEERPLIRITPGSVQSWGRLQWPDRSTQSG